MAPTVLFLSGESHGQRSLEGYRVAKSWTHLKRLNAHAQSKTLMTLLILCVIKFTKGSVIKTWNQQNAGSKMQVLFLQNGSVSGFLKELFRKEYSLFPSESILFSIYKVVVVQSLSHV